MVKGRTAIGGARGTGHGNVMAPKTAKRARRCERCGAGPWYPCTRKTGAGQMVGTGGQYDIAMKTLHKER